MTSSKRMWAAYVLSLGGLFATWMLTVSYLFRVQLPCGGGDGCTAVALSPAARLAGIPVPLFGLALYVALAAVTLRSILLPNGPRPAIPYLLAVLGAAVSTVFTVYGVLVLHAQCIWCLASNVIVCLLAILYGVERGATTVAPSTGKAKLLALAVTVAAFAGMGLSGARIVKSARHFPWNPEALAKSSVTDMAPTDSILINGRDAGPIIVMFVDFQCPACQASFQSVYGAALKHHVRLAIRQRPHNKLHPESYSLAVQCEEAIQQEQGLNFVVAAFKQGVEDRLKGRDLLKSLGARESAQLVKVAETRVKRDKAFAKQLGLSQTPSIFIVRSNRTPQPVIATSLEEALSGS